MKVIFLGPQKLTHLKFEKIIKNSFCENIIWLNSFKELVKENKKNSGKILVFLCDDFCSNNLIMGHQIQSMLNKDSNLYFISENEPKGFESDYINESISLEDLSLRLETIFKVNKTDALMYMELPIQYIRKLKVLKVDIYLQLSAAKYIKVFRKEDSFCNDQLEKYYNKGIKSLYVKASDKKILLQSIESSVEVEQKQESRISIESKLAMTSVLNEAISVFGVSPEMVKLANHMSMSSLKEIEHDGGVLSSIAHEIIKGESFLYEHSLMISYIALELSRRIKWVSENSFKKLSFAALIHDAFLSEEIAYIHDVEPDRIPELGWKEIRSIEQHENKLIDALRHSGIGLGSIDIIRNHHALSLKKNGEELSMSSCLFILAERYALQFFKHGLSFKKYINPEDELNLYSNEKIKQILPTLHEMIAA